MTRLHHPMWNHRDESLPHGLGINITLRQDARPVSFADVLALWRDVAEFRGYFSGLLGALPYSAFRWETPALSTASQQRPFECVALNDPSLEVPPEPWVFAEHFQDADPAASVLTFPNLGGDALLVVPRQLGPALAYPHLAAFLRHAPAAQVDELWRQVGCAALGRLGQRPFWLSTAGGGVAWLHVRLDQRPKYYLHAPYRSST